MVLASPEQVRSDAERMFRVSDVPEIFRFVGDLSPLDQRLFVRDLWEAVSKASISATPSDLQELIELIEAWEATADLNRAPEVSAAIRRQKNYRVVA